MMNIDTLFEELVALDPSFRDHEKEVRSLIGELLKNRPDVPLDEAFVARLRSRLSGMPTPSPISFFSLHYLTLGVLAVLLVVPLGFYAATHRNGSGVFTMDQKINHLANNAYGSITAQTDAGSGGAAAFAAAPANQAEHVTLAAAPMDSARDAAPAAKVGATALTVSSASSAGSPSTPEARMLLPQGPMTTYSYVYKGDPLELSAQGQVYSREKTQNSSSQIATQLRRANFGLANLGSFADAKVQSFQIAEDRPYGYTIDVNFADGMIGINPNYAQWPSLSGKETAQAQLPQSAMLSDEEILSLANSFLAEHGISTALYAEPVVQKDQGTGPEALQYAPEQVTVTYPLKIEGTEIVEDGAYPYGLQVGVSIRDKRVQSVYGLSAQNYSSSAYDLVADSDKILSVLAKGGPHSWTPPADSGIQVKNIAIEVGTPKKVLLHTYTYRNRESKELFVPALSFPVTKAPSGETYAPKTIVVPLVAELLENNQGGPVLYDMMR